MVFNFNIFRILGDVSHTLSKVVLIHAIHRNKSSEGVSLITQVLYLLVFVARYLPSQYWHTPPWKDWHLLWNWVLMTFYIVSSGYILVAMTRMFARTRETEKAWKLSIFASTGALLLAPFVMLVFDAREVWGAVEFCWVFSIILESIAVLPQLAMLRQTSVPTVIDSFYLATLGAYRGFYLLNWIIRGFQERDDRASSAYGDFWISVIFGILQTALYIDFGLVYITRQRLKLRGGSVIDTDDFNHGWLVKRIIGRRSGSFDEETVPQDAEGAPTRTPQRWGRRGISVSADEGLVESIAELLPGTEPQERLADPQEFEDDVSDDETRTPPQMDRIEETASGAATEWRSE